MSVTVGLPHHPSIRVGGAVDCGRRMLSRQALQLRDGVRQSILPLPFAAVAASTLTLIIHLIGAPAAEADIDNGNS
jgi:hypothetical protein